jgi:cytoskeletal protein RodZ
MGDFGGTLKSARERKGIQLRQIANATKISMGALESLEKNDFSRLPGGIFSRSFVRAYAQEVGLDPDETVSDFLKETGETFQPPSQIVEENAPIMPEHTDPGLDMQPSLAPKLVKLAFIAIPLVAAIVYFAMKEAATGPAAPVAVGEQAQPQQPQQAPPETAAAAPAAAAATGPIPDLAPGETMRMVLEPTGECWVSLTVDGTVRISRLMAAGERETHEIREGAELNLGSAGAMSFTINGRRSKPIGEPGAVETLRITRANFKDFLQ